MGEEGDYAYRYTVTIRMTPALRWASDERHFLFTNRRSSEIQGTVLGKCLQAWPVYIQVHACGCSAE